MSAYVRNINVESCSGSQSLVLGTTSLCHDCHGRLQVVPFDEVYFGLCFVGNYGSRCVSEAGSDTFMGHAVSPSLVLGLCRYLVGGAGCGMLLLLLTLPGSPERIMLYYPDNAFHQH
jgi:hypothetical protein